MEVTDIVSIATFPNLHPMLMSFVLNWLHLCLMVSIFAHNCAQRQVGWLASSMKYHLLNHHLIPPHQPRARLPVKRGEVVLWHLGPRRGRVAIRKR